MFIIIINKSNPNFHNVSVTITRAFFRLVVISKVKIMDIQILDAIINCSNIRPKQSQFVNHKTLVFLLYAGADFLYCTNQTYMFHSIISKYCGFWQLQCDLRLYTEYQCFRYFLVFKVLPYLELTRKVIMIFVRMFYCCIVWLFVIPILSSMKLFMSIVFFWIKNFEYIYFYCKDT